MSRFVERLHITIENEHVFVNNVYFCRAGIGKDRERLKPLHGEARTEYSHTFHKVMVKVDGLGLIGAEDTCDVVLGNVRGPDGVIPCQATAERLVYFVDQAETSGRTATVEVTYA